MHHIGVQPSPGRSGKPRSNSPGEVLMTCSTSDVAVCCSNDSHEIVGALSQFVEQPRVLDGDDGLGGEILTKAICLSVKAAYLGAM